jgi:hypothetical protein
MRLSRLRKGRLEGLAGAMTTIRRALAVGTILLGLAAPACATAAPHHEYVLKHPKREHCKASYVKKIEKVKMRRRGKVVKVRKTFCVWVAPQKVWTPAQPPPPQQSQPPPPQQTATTLTVKPRGCEFFSYGGIATVDICEYILVVSVADSAGVPITSALPTPNLVFTNAGKPGESWTVPGAAEVGIFAQEECVEKCYASIYRAMLNALGEVRKIPIASVLEGGSWSVVAVYGGSAEYSGSSSAPQAL